MGTTFRNSPLIEIIAELRWDAPAVAQDHPPFVFPDRAGPYEDMFMRWVAKMGARGYEHAERLVPSGFPLHPHAPAVRVKPKTGEEQTTLFQLGPHLFTANAIPPYRSWDDFSPVVRDGVAALLAARPETDARTPLVASLRYIDAFREDLRQGLSCSRFLAETLGMRVNVNPAIERHLVAGEEIGALVQLAVPTEGGALRIQFAEGETQGKSALIMDMTLALSDVIEPDLDTLMAAFDGAREVMHQLFVELTAPIADLMQPE